MSPHSGYEVHWEEESSTVTCLHTLTEKSLNAEVSRASPTWESCKSQLLSPCSFTALDWHGIVLDQYWQYRILNQNIFKMSTFVDEVRILASTQKKEGGNFKNLSTSKYFLHFFDHIKAKKGGWPTPLCCFS